MRLFFADEKEANPGPVLRAITVAELPAPEELFDFGEFFRGQRTVRVSETCIIGSPESGPVPQPDRFIRAPSFESGQVWRLFSML